MNNVKDSWPLDGLVRVSECPVCGESARVLLHGALTDRVFRTAPGTWELHQCLACHASYLDPCPSPETIGMAYVSYYTHSAGNHPIVRRIGLIRSALHDLINGYIEAKYAIHQQRSIKLGAWILPTVPPLRSAVDGMFRHLPLPPDGGGAVLDVGCGNGDFLSLARDMGWVAKGIDMDPTAVKVARERGLDVQCVNVEELAVTSEGQFDVITLSHVIEHVHRPVDLLKTLHSMLKPGGVLWLETPNLYSLGHSRFGANWRDLDPPRHLVLFTPDALRRALKEAGFEDIRQRWRGMVLFAIFAASNSIARGDAQIASRDGKPPLREIAYELIEMIWPRRREFLTMTARK